ncbi:hypothetical protein FOZ62_004771 [Perkinsus olseni]|uniref:Uncharacterized protein n=1 Tax=Perkinsus olseni TaxID=32597 RepID=A0A7J6PY67_PEROL|nr:hypothetical protein FOZ62_004771 [Perkinsus olseni]
MLLPPERSIFVLSSIVWMEAASVGSAAAPQLPSVGVYVSVTDAKLPTGVSKTSVEVKPKGDGGMAADLIIDADGRIINISDLTLQQPFKNTQATTKHQQRIKDDCYSLGKHEDIKKYQQFAAWYITNFQPDSTQICVDRESVDETGRYTRATLLLGRTGKYLKRRAEYEIKLELERSRVDTGRKRISSKDQTPSEAHPRATKTVGMVTQDGHRALGSLGRSIDLDPHLIAAPSWPTAATHKRDRYEEPMDLSRRGPSDSSFTVMADTSKGAEESSGRKRPRKQSKPRRLLASDRRGADLREDYWATF